MDSMPNKAQAIDLLTKFMQKSPGINYRDYDDVRTWRAVQRRIGKDLHACKMALELFSVLPYHPEILKEVSETEFSGGLEFTDEGTALEYTAGRNWTTEYRAALATVLEAYNRKVRKLEGM